MGRIGTRERSKGRNYSESRKVENFLSPTGLLIFGNMTKSQPRARPPPSILCYLYVFAKTKVRRAARGRPRCQNARRPPIFSMAGRKQPSTLPCLLLARTISPWPYFVCVGRDGALPGHQGHPPSPSAGGPCGVSARSPAPMGRPGLQPATPSLRKADKSVSQQG